MKTGGLMFRECRAFLLLCYPASVMAANNALGTQFEGYTPATIGILVLLICIGGMTGMLHRLKTEYENKGELGHPKLFIVSNLFGAVVAGVLALLIGEGGSWPGWMLAIAILVSSFAGTLLIERVWMTFAARYLPTDGSEIKVVELIKPSIAPRKPDGNIGKYD